jgi:hypothetical protein
MFDETTGDSISMIYEGDEVTVLDTEWVGKPTSDDKKVRVLYEDNTRPMLGVVPAWALHEDASPRRDSSDSVASEPEHAPPQVVPVRSADPMTMFIATIRPGRAYVINGNDVNITKDDGTSELARVTDGDKVEVMTDQLESASPAELEMELIKVRYFDVRNDKPAEGYVQAWFLKKA